MATTAYLPAPLFSLTATPPLPRRPAPIVRRPTPGQGHALCLLAHAIEYLIDSRLSTGGNTDDENEALRILMRLSRDVFDGCPERVSVASRLTGWIAHRRRTSEA